MQQRLLFLTFLLFASVPEVGFAQEDVHASPSNRFSIVNIGDTASANLRFEIRIRSGSVFFSSKDELAHSLGVDPHFFKSHANNILWSPDEKSVLFSFNTGKQKSTAIFFFPEQKLISFGYVEDGYTLPVRWITSQKFVVENSTPMGGKALGGVRIWRQTYKIHLQPFGVECVYTGPTTVTVDVPYNPQ
jgi:hypothetical protein